MSEQDFGSDYEKAKRILAQPGCEMTVSAEELATWIREARERGMYDPTPEQRLARTIVAERILAKAKRRRRGWPIPNAP